MPTFTLVTVIRKPDERTMLLSYMVPYTGNDLDEAMAQYDAIMLDSKVDKIKTRELAMEVLLSENEDDRQ